MKNNALPLMIVALGCFLAAVGFVRRDFDALDAMSSVAASVTLAAGVAGARHVSKKRRKKSEPKS